MKTLIQTYDTTLRDGAQGEGVNFELRDKLALTRVLDDFGFNYVEGGFPASNAKDLQYFRRVQRLELSHAKVVAFGMTCRAGVVAAEDANLRALADAGTSVVTIVGKGDVSQVGNVLRVSPEENLRMIADSVAFLKGLPHVREVFFDVEHYFDGFRLDPAYALSVLRAAAAGGADCLVLCDTNGGTLTRDIGHAVTVAAEVVGVPLGIHAHNDCGLAVANTLAAVEHGVRQVQGTINGFGERCGNVDLCTVLANLALKYSDYDALPEDRLARLRELSQSVYKAACLDPRPDQPYVGRSAFAHKGGLHVDAITKVTSAYEHVDPKAVGGERRVLSGEHSGRATFDVKLREMGLELNREQLSMVAAKVKNAPAGYNYEEANASLFLLARQVVGYAEPWFRISDSTYHDRHQPNEQGRRQVYDAMATVKGELRVVENELLERGASGWFEFHTAAEGAGPVDAFDKALRKALRTYCGRRFETMGDIKLVDYTVRVLGDQQGADAAVRVLVTFSDGRTLWTALGVAKNVVRASFEAVKEAYQFRAFVTADLAETFELESAPRAALEVNARALPGLLSESMLVLGG